jgi:hypothetical protein
MKTLAKILILFILALALWGYGPIPTSAAPVTLSEVPAYNWYHGCGPTSAGSIIGYWDLHGYPNLFSASGWDNVKLTANVRDQISSPTHNAKYDPTPDAAGPTPPFTSIADWFRTSMDPMPYGWSHQSDAPGTFEGYANYRGYDFTSYYQSLGSGVGNFSWTSLVQEIDAGRPMMFLVDSNGDGGTDHFVSVLGYDDEGANRYYGCYDTWSEDETIRWYEFLPMASGTHWGIAYATFVTPVSPPVPIPSTMVLLGSGLMGLVGWRKFRKS